MPSSSFAQARNAALRALLSDKLHAFPGAGDYSPGALLKALLRQLSPLPTALLRWWAAHPRGHVVITGQGRGYVPGPQAAGVYTLDGVAWVSAEAVLSKDAGPLEAVARLLDHLLGCHGEEGGPWLSEGGGISPAWREVGARLHDLFTLGYGPTPETQTDPRAYFAWGFALSLRDPRSLNVMDPRLQRLLHATLLSERFWRSATEEGSVRPRGAAR